MRRRPGMSNHKSPAKNIFNIPFRGRSRHTADMIADTGIGALPRPACRRVVRPKLAEPAPCRDAAIRRAR